MGKHRINVKNCIRVKVKVKKAPFSHFLHSVEKALLRMCQDHMELLQNESWGQGGAVRDSLFGCRVEFSKEKFKRQGENVGIKITKREECSRRETRRDLCLVPVSLGSVETG